MPDTEVAESSDKFSRKISDKDSLLLIWKEQFIDALTVLYFWLPLMTSLYSVCCMRCQSGPIYVSPLKLLQNVGSCARPNELVNFMYSLIVHNSLSFVVLDNYLLVGGSCSNVIVGTLLKYSYQLSDAFLC